MTDASDQGTFRARELLAALKRAGVELWLANGELRFRAPQGALDGEARQNIAAHREEIIALLSSSEPAGTLPPPAIQSDVPLSFAQQRLWFLYQLDPTSPQYNIGRVSRIRRPVNPRLLSSALTDLFDRHPAFRTRIYEDHGSPKQEIMARSAVELELRELDVPEAERSEAASALSIEALKQPFDLGAGQVARFRLVTFAEDDYLLLLVMHHIVSDGISLEIIANDLEELYQARAEGRPANLPPLTKTYAGFAISERSRVETESWSRSEAEFWREVLRDAPPLLELPSSRPRPPLASASGARLYGKVDHEIISRLRIVAREEGATLFMALLAVWQTLLARLSGQTDVIVGTPISTRDEEDYEKVVGCFINNIALRGDLSGQPPYGALLQRTKQSVLAAFRHAAFPFDMVVETVKPRRTAAYTPIFQVLFTLLSSPAGEDGDSMDETGASRFDLSLELSFAADGGMKASYEYAADLFDEALIDRLHRHFVLLLRAAGEDPSRSLMAASLVTPEEERQICVTWNSTGLAFDPEATVPLSIRKMAQLAPLAPAVRSGEAEAGYADFDARADVMATLLAERGAGPGTRVVVALPRTLDLPVALAAVLRTGAAYIPVDPSHPFERIATIVEDASPVCGVTVSEHARLFPGLTCLCVDEMDWHGNAPPFDRPIDPNSPAYLIYTSGSTGRPKGVEVSHRNLVSFLAAMRVEPGINAGDKLLAITTPSFDIAGLELWLPLTSGGCVVLAGEDCVADGAALAELISQHDIKIMQATPAGWRLLLDEGWTGKPDLKALCGGEAMPVDLAQALVERVGALWNVYGPTETTIWSAAHRVSSTDPGTARIPIGKPIANTRLYVLEPGGTIAPPGVPGELLIAGEGVSLGYRNLPELTSERFVERDIAGRKERVYRTGDRARWRSNGELDFLGRNDGQVKIRGFRIELAEVEAALVSHPHIRETYAAVLEGAGGANLVAYIVYEDAGAPTTSELRRYLRGRLPDYMIPSLFVSIESVPLSPHGKVDRGRLPDPFSHGLRGSINEEPLKPGLEETIAGVWREYLETASVGPADNFYELGGNSLLSLRVAAAIARRTGWRMDPRAMFFQTLREVAAGAQNAGGGARS